MLILDGDGILVFKNANGICKPDAMFLVIRFGLARIPFVVHRIELYAQMCTGASPLSPTVMMAGGDVTIIVVLIVARVWPEMVLLKTSNADVPVQYQRLFKQKVVPASRRNWHDL